MTKLKDIFEAKINGTTSPLIEAASLANFEKVLDILVKKGKDFVTTNMVWVEMNKLSAIEAKEVGDLLKKHLVPAEGKAGYFDVASYGELKEGKDNAAAIALRTKIAAGLKELGFSKKEQKETPGVVRYWAAQKNVKYDFADKKALDQFIKDLKGVLPELKFKLNKKFQGAEGNARQGWNINDMSDDYSITTQDYSGDGKHTAVVVSIPKDNTAGEKWRDGFDA